MGIVCVAGLTGVTACGGAYPGVAAMVNGKTIRDSDLDAVATDLQPYLRQGQRLPPQNVLTALIMQPFIIDRLKASNKMVAPDEAARALHQMATAGGAGPKDVPAPEQWATPTKELAQAQIGMETLSSADQNRIHDALSRAKVVVDPKYGEFQLPRGVTPAVPNWLDQTERSSLAPGGQQQQPQQPEPQQPQPQPQQPTR